MSNAALAFFTGLGNGYLDGKELGEKKARQAKEDARDEERYQAERQERQDKQAAVAALRQAAAPMEAGAGGMSKPEWMDNRDVGLPENAALVNGGLEATANANTPQAVRARQVAALRGLDPERADRMEQSGKTSALTDLQISEAEAAAADRDWRRKLGVAMSAGHAGLAELASKSEFGPLAGKQVRAVPTADKKSVVYHLVGEDGSLTPVPEFTFTTDEAGIAKAGFILDRSIPPQTRWEAAQLEKQREAQAQHQQATLAETSRHNRATEGISREDLGLRREKLNAEKVAPEKAPAGYRFTADGSLQAIPGGPADQKIQGAFNADTAAVTGAMSSFDRLATAANELKSHPGLKGITGVQGALPNMPGSNAANAEALMNTLKSQVAFGVLQDMRNQSKTGGALGAVSEKELLLLQNNLAALDKAQDKASMEKALANIIAYTDQAKERMQGAFNLKHGGRQGGDANAGAAALPARTPAPPQPGTVQDGYRFKGGDPANQSNWEPAK